MKLIAFVFLVLVLGFGAAWYFEWITLSTARDSKGEVSDVNVKINRDKINEDIERGRAAVSKVVDEVKEGKEKSKEETVRGAIRVAKSDQVTLDVAGKTMTFKLTAETKIKLEDRVGAASDLRPGQEIRLSYIERDGQQISQEITVVSTKK